MTVTCHQSGHTASAIIIRQHITHPYKKYCPSTKNISTFRSQRASTPPISRRLPTHPRRAISNFAVPPPYLRSTFAPPSLPRAKGKLDLSLPTSLLLRNALGIHQNGQPPLSKSKFSVSYFRIIYPPARANLSFWSTPQLHSTRSIILPFILSPPFYSFYYSTVRSALSSYSQYAKFQTILTHNRASRMNRMC